MLTLWKGRDASSGIFTTLLRYLGSNREAMLFVDDVCAATDRTSTIGENLLKSSASTSRECGKSTQRRSIDFFSWLLAFYGKCPGSDDVVIDVPFIDFFIVLFDAGGSSTVAVVSPFYANCYSYLTGYQLRGIRHFLLVGWVIFHSRRAWPKRTVITAVWKIEKWKIWRETDLQWFIFVCLRQSPLRMHYLLAMKGL